MWLNAESRSDTSFQVDGAADDSEVDAFKHLDLGGVAGVGTGAVSVAGGDIQGVVALGVESEGQVDLRALRHCGSQGKAVATCNTNVVSVNIDTEVIIC